MAHDTDSIEREISNVKRTLDRQLTAAEEKARAAVDWRTHYRRNPLPLLAGAAAVGFVASALVGGDSVAGGDTDAPATDRRGGALTAPLRASLQSPTLNNAFEHLLDAFVAASSVKVAEYVEQWMPGFREEFSRRHT